MSVAVRTEREVWDLDTPNLRTSPVGEVGEFLCIQIIEGKRNHIPSRKLTAHLHRAGVFPHFTLRTSSVEAR